MEKKINKMNKGDLVNLIEENVENINTINSYYKNIDSTREKVEEGAAKILDTKDETGNIGYLEEIETKRKEIEDKHNEIINTYNEVLIDNEEDESIKTKLLNLVDTFSEYNKDFKKIKDDFFGSTVLNENDEEVEKIGYINKTKKEIKDLKENINKLEEKISGELISGVTTITLSKVFKEKAEEYKKTRKGWELLLILIIITAIFYSIVVIDKQAIEIGQLFIKFILHIPVFTFIIWFIVFAGNRRAENKKLEESYTHKAAISQSFVGYKESIEKLEDEDNKLLIKHMNNLLEAISKDSGSFLSSKGENHPITTAAKTMKSEITKKFDRQ